MRRWCPGSSGRRLLRLAGQLRPGAVVGFADGSLGFELGQGDRVDFDQVASTVHGSPVVGPLPSQSYVHHLQTPVGFRSDRLECIRTAGMDACLVWYTDRLV